MLILSLPIQRTPELEACNAYDKEYADNCRELPLYCYEMTSCSEAEEAFECGNYDLDRDGDGVPCESLCGSY